MVLFPRLFPRFILFPRFGFKYSVVTVSTSGSMAGLVLSRFVACCCVAPPSWGGIGRLFATGGFMLQSI